MKLLNHSLFRLKIFGLFFALFCINLVLVYSYQKHQNTVEKRLEILTEIDNSRKLPIPSSAPLVLGTSTSMESSIQIADARSANLRHFFRTYNSPLYDYAEDMVAISDKYNFDYRLLAAIAMQESGLCRIIPENSHNCWGFGIYGTQVLRFDSYPEAMEAVAKTLKRDYIDKGLITPELIMSKYTPSSNGSWARGVGHFLNILQ